MSRKRLYWGAGVAIVVVLALAGLFLWRGRSVSFAQVFPLSDVEAPLCDAVMEHTGDGPDWAGELTPGQVREVLSHLEGQSFRRTGSGAQDAFQSGMEYLVRLYFQEENSSRRCELILTGDKIYFNDLSQGSGESCTPSGGQAAQEELAQLLCTMLTPQVESRTVGALYQDLDGDGTDETVRLCTTPMVQQGEDGRWELISEAAFLPYRLETEVDGQTVIYNLDRDPGYGPEPVFFPLESRDGAPLVAAGLPAMSGGGAGRMDVYVLAWEDGGFVPLAVPEYSIQGTREDMTAHVVVPETGNTEDLDLAWWLETREQEAVSDEAGVMTWPAAPAAADSVCALAQADRGLRIAQYIWGTAHADGMGYLVTQLTWDRGEPAVLEQTFSWLPQEAEDAVR